MRNPTAQARDSPGHGWCLEATMVLVAPVRLHSTFQGHLGSCHIGRTENIGTTFHTLSLPSPLIACPGFGLGKMGLRRYSLKDTGHSPGLTWPVTVGFTSHHCIC
ncbi:unnamed protein product [Pipistrellus nathusii]|uniref:Uncharacterized protein n=1 Tax=Pipistrellus nathusii TaxID=59473 RepID=A0ABN9ZND7_PIPNA